MFVDLTEVFVWICVKSIIGGLVNYTYLGLLTCLLGGWIRLCLFPFIDWEEVNCLVFEDFTSLDFPKVRAQDLKGIVWCHWESLVWGCSASLLSTKWWHLWINQFLLIWFSWDPRWVECNACWLHWARALIHYIVAAHWLILGRGLTRTVKSDRTNRVQMFINAKLLSRALSTNCIFTNRVLIIPWTGIRCMGCHHVLLIGSFIYVYRSLLNTTFFESLCLFF